MGLKRYLDPVLKVIGHRTRRCFFAEGKAHIEFRRVEPSEYDAFARALEEAVEAAPGVHWAEVNPYTRRVVVAYDDRALGQSELVALIEAAEKAQRLEGARFGDEKPEHPADVEPLARTLVEMGSDVFGLGLAGVLRVARVKPLPIQADAAAILSLLDSVPSLRRVLDDNLGPLTTELSLNIATSIVQGLNQGPMSLVVDIVHRSLLVREIQARRRAWERREPELCQKPAGLSARKHRPEPRPVPLPKGPVERYAERAWFASLGGFGVGVATTQSFEKATAPLLGCLPKPARLGREAFAAQLGRALAARDITVLDSRVLRHLERVDTLVLQGDLVVKARFLLAEVVPGRTIDAGQARRRATGLFDAERPIEVQRRRGWSLGPIGALEVAGAPELSSRSTELLRRGALVLGLAHKDEVVALVEVQVSPQTDVEAVIATARRAEMRVVVASSDPTAVERLGVDEVVPDGRALAEAVHHMQRGGNVVCVVGTSSSPGLAAADVGVGLVHDGGTPPWGAHLLCKDDLGHARFIVEACLSARDASKQGVHLALGAASVGAFLSAGGLVPNTSRRVMNAVNSATLLAIANGLRIAAQLDRRPQPALYDPTPWHALSAEGSLARLGASPDGLSRREVARRRRPPIPPVPAVFELGRAIFEELLNPLAPLLAAGAGLSAVVGSFTDAAMVAGVVGVNAVLGGVQRFSTERSIAALGRAERRTVRVRRAGRELIIPADDLVRGDLVVLQAGEVVPADCRIVESASLEADESSLTGESLPVAKSAEPSFAAAVGDRSSMLFEGTSVAAGRALAVVVAKGSATEARRGMAAAQGAIPASGVEARLESMMELTAPAVALAGMGVVGAGLLRGRPLGEIIDSAVSLAVAAVPEGLPLLATAAQLAAARRLSERGALVRNPRSIEALGRVDVLCIDKTGTLTEGQIHLRCVSDGAHEEPILALAATCRMVLAAGLRAGPDGSEGGDLPHSADRALLLGAGQSGVTADLGAEGWERLAELPFEAARGYHAVLGQAAGGHRLCVKGAPEIVLPRCTDSHRPDGVRPLGDRGRARLAAEASRLARRGLRVLAVAERVLERDGGIADEQVSDLVFRGFLGFADPVRPSAAEAIAGIRRAGVEVVMATGDHPSTAETIAAELDLIDLDGGKGILTGADLDVLTDDELAERLPRVAVLARVTPSHKVRIVKAFQRSGRVVAMTGDGANDAPAIRLADVGIALSGRSTPAARGAADVVVTDDRIETLVDAIVEGRAMWSSVRDAVSILVGGNLGEVGFTVLGSLIDGRSPLNARQLLLVNLLTDVVPAMAISLRPPKPTSMEALLHEGPATSLAEALDRDITLRAVTTGVGAALGWGAGRLTGTRKRASTVALVSLVGTQLAQTLVAGGRSRGVVAAAAGSAAALAAIVQTPGVSGGFGCTPLGPLGWLSVFAATGTATTASLVAPRIIEIVRSRSKTSTPTAAGDPGVAVRGAHGLLGSGR